MKNIVEFHLVWNETELIYLDDKIHNGQSTVTAPLMDAASNQKSLFWGTDYNIKNAQKMRFSL